MDLGKAMRIAQAISGMTQKDLAAATGLSPSYVSLVATGHRAPSPEVLRQVCEATGVSSKLFTILGENASALDRLSRHELDEVASEFIKLIITPAHPVNTRRPSARSEDTCAYCGCDIAPGDVHYKARKGLLRCWGCEQTKLLEEFEQTGLLSDQLVTLTRTASSATARADGAAQFFASPANWETLQRITKEHQLVSEEVARLDGLLWTPTLKGYLEANKQRKHTGFGGMFRVEVLRAPGRILLTLERRGPKRYKPSLVVTFGGAPSPRLQSCSGRCEELLALVDATENFPELTPIEEEQT